MSVDVKYVMVRSMLAARLKTYRFQIRNGNHFTLLVDGDVFFKEMLNAIGQAQQHILLEQYLVKSGHLTNRFIQALCGAAQRGVAVYLLLDDYGASNLSQTDRLRLENAGIKSCFFNPIHFKRFFHSLFRNHRKSLIVDGQHVFIGGAGLADEFSADISGPLAWYDVMLEIQGEVVQDWTQLFIQTWQKHSLMPINLKEPGYPSHIANQAGRLLTSSPFSHKEINRALIKHLRRSQHRVWITSPYFIATRKIRRILHQTARRGVDVRLLLPGPYSDHPWISFAARRYYMRMLKNHVRIFEYQPRFIHAKMQVCDDWVSIGSSNLDRWNQHWNLDANQTIYEADFAAETGHFFEQAFKLSKEITLSSWRQRPWWTRLRESLSGLVVLWLERISRLYR